MNRFVILDQDNKALDVIVWDEVEEWCPPEGCRVVLESSAEGRQALAVKAAEQKAEMEASRTSEDSQ
jgi:hypothetical protein